MCAHNKREKIRNLKVSVSRAVEEGRDQKRSKTGLSRVQQAQQRKNTCKTKKSNEENTRVNEDTSGPLSCYLDTGNLNWQEEKRKMGKTGSDGFELTGNGWLIFLRVVAM
ncbi:hypothetical protein RUM43_010972 [Polyplax serrata]|uniref:Uncharacterized protein n=1 Tax=Polyplax serrata TaxID=468196 RepID=A0AAN8PE33_POLSC